MTWKLPGAFLDEPRPFVKRSFHFGSCVACGWSWWLVPEWLVREKVIVDGLWERLAPLIPPRTRRFRHPGRHPRDDRAVLAGILFVIRTGIPWQRLPTSAFGVSGSTCWRRLASWQEQGVWQRLHEVLLAELRAAGALDLARAVVDASRLRAVKGGAKVGPSPVDRGRPGSKHHPDHRRLRHPPSE